VIRILLLALLRRLKRDPLLLALTFILGPFFVLLYKLIFLQGMTVYRVVIVQNEAAQESALMDLVDEYGRRFVEEMRNRRYPGGADLFDLIEVQDVDEGLRLLRDHDAYCMLRFSGSTERLGVEILGDFSNPYYLICSQLIQNNLKDFLLLQQGLAPPADITEMALGNSGGKTEFENYIPGLVIFSTLVLMYLFTILLVKEVESKVFYRYRMSGVPGCYFTSSYTLLFLGLTAIAVLLTLGSAFALGYHSALSILNDIFLSLGLCLVLSLASAGIAFAIAALASNISEAFVLTTFPFMLLVFFSGSVYPFPKIELGPLFGRTIGLFDFLPSTHAVTALGKILTFGISPLKLIYESAGLMVLSLLFYLGGVILFIRKRWMRCR